MKASEARILAEGNNYIVPFAERDKYNEIIEKIKAEAKKGNISIYWYEPVSQKIINVLQNDGFQIESSNYRNEFLLTIKW